MTISVPPIRSAGEPGHVADHNLISADLTTLDGALAAKSPLVSLYCPSTASNVPTMPHAAGVQVGDAIDARLDCTKDDWTSQTGFIGKLTSTAGASTVGWGFTQTTSNRWVFNVSDGTNFVQFVSASGLITGLSLAAGQRLRVRVTYTRNTGSGSYSIKFWYSTDFTTALASDTSWTQLGAESTGSSIGATNDLNTAVSVGAQRAQDTLVGKLYGAAILINGTAIAAPNFHAPVGPRLRDSYGNVWTLNGTAWSWMVD